MKRGDRVKASVNILEYEDTGIYYICKETQGTVLTETLDREKRFNVQFDTPTLPIYVSADEIEVV